MCLPQKYDKVMAYLPTRDTSFNFKQTYVGENMTHMRPVLRRKESLKNT